MNLEQHILSPDLIDDVDLIKFSPITLGEILASKYGGETIYPTISFAGRIHSIALFFYEVPSKTDLSGHEVLKVRVGDFFEADFIIEDKLNLTQLDRNQILKSVRIANLHEISDEAEA